MSPLPLEGYRVLELAHLIAGPVCGMYLADMGADVRTLDPPIRLGATPGARRSPASALGEHTDAVLGESRFTADEIGTLRRAGAAR